MAEPDVYLEKLSAFSRMLRLQGLAVSPKETEDASRLLIALGMDDRERVKTALRTVYSKSREEQLTFDRVFDGFFISEEKMRQQAKEQMQREQELQQHRKEAEEDLQLNGQPMDLDESQRETYAAMPEEERQRLRNFMDKYRGTAERNPKLYGDFIHSVFARAIMEQQMLMENAGTGGEELDPEIGILYRDISDFKDTEIPKPLPSSSLLPDRSTANCPPSEKREGIPANWISGKPSARVWKPAAASINCGIKRSGPTGNTWCCCVMCPAPWCSFRSLPCGLFRA